MLCNVAKHCAACWVVFTTKVRYTRRRSPSISSDSRNYKPLACAFSFMIMNAYPEDRIRLERFQTAIVTFEFSQSHYWCHTIGRIRLPINLPLQFSILYHFRGDATPGRARSNDLGEKLTLWLSPRPISFAKCMFSHSLC